jgi:hypothetical protein
MRLMKQLSLLVGVGLVAALPLSAAEVTVKGEIVDQVCYKKDKANKGADHKDCNTSCVKKGQPAALVTADGEVYALSGSYTENKNAKLVDLVGQMVEAKGEVSEMDGKKVLNAKGIIAIK